MLSKKRELPRYLYPQERHKKIIQILLLCLPVLVSFLKSFGLNIPLPGCPLLHYLGIPCPGWGLTRSFQAIAHGNVLQAFNFHLFGPILFIIALNLIFHLIQEIIKNKHISNTYIKILGNSTYQISFLLIVFGYHATRLHNRWKTGELSDAFIHSPLVEGFLTTNWSLIKNLLYN